MQRKNIFEIFESHAENILIKFLTLKILEVAPVTNSSYQRTFNGCGSKGIIIDPSKLPTPQFEQCCNNHDYCYDTCNIKKDDCDTAFRNCMLIACGNAFNCDTNVCQFNAESFYNIVKQFGCSSYLDSQRGACICY